MNTTHNNNTTNPCTEEEWAEAPFCGGPSHQGTTCDMGDMSARGFCPGEEGHMEQLCSLDGINLDLCKEEEIETFEDTTTTTTATTTTEEVTPLLPEAGVGDFTVMATLALALLSTGFRMVRH